MAATALSIALNGLVPYLAGQIQKWQPEPYPRELGYRDALKAYLKAKLPKAHIESEYRDHGTTADLLVRWQGALAQSDVYIELKRNLKSKSEHDRLVGQIEALKPKKNRIIVVLCGESSVRFVENLREHYAPYCGDEGSMLPDFRVPSMAIVTVGAPPADQP